MIYAVIDTNVFVSAMLSKLPDSATVKVVQAFKLREIKLLYNQEILDEYKDVLSRPRLKLPQDDIEGILSFIVSEGMPMHRTNSYEIFPDPDDAVFYEVALSKEDAYVVTGNTKHFPKTPIVVTPAQMLEILHAQG